LQLVDHLHSDADPAVPLDLHRHQWVDIERGQQHAVTVPHPLSGQAFAEKNDLRPAIQRANTVLSRTKSAIRFAGRTIEKIARRSSAMPRQHK
jgi:hypothetical protein